MLYRLVRVPNDHAHNGAYQGSPLLNDFANDGWRAISCTLDPADRSIIVLMERDDSAPDV